MGIANYRNLFIVFVAQFINGCHFCDDYRYIKIAQSNELRVESLGVLPLKGSFGVSPYPIAYSLERAAYKLRLEVNSLMPAINIFDSSGSGSINLKLLPNESVDNLSCYTDTGRSNGDSISYVWLGRSGCMSKMTIEFIVMDKNGSELGVERLPFTLVENGSYCIEDGM